ncbi:MAG TPA: response regulator transcription factor [Nitrospiraceae bacterium]|nr:response regulator transcription factor [Nitrospiraceae bacterium]
MRDPRAHPIRLLMVDDHEVLRLGLRTLFSEAGGFELVGEAGTMAEAISMARELDPDVILMDVRLPDGSGVEACREIRTQRPQTRVLFLTSYADDDAVLATIVAGAQGFLLKEVGSEELLRAVRAVANGQSILDPAVTQRVLARVQTLSSSSTSTEPKEEPLSPQERRVLALVAEGKTNKEIAVALNLSEKTVGNYLGNVFQKLNITRRSQAAVYFTRHFPQ